jgi:hypothetical protein
VKKSTTRTSAPRNDPKVRSNHPLVGTWEQEPSTGATTSVVYTVSIRQGKFWVSAKDGEDGTVFDILRTKWDGHCLRFTSRFPPTEHKAKHVLTALSKAKMSHKLSGTYADGEIFSEQQVWRKIRNKKK